MEARRILYMCTVLVVLSCLWGLNEGKIRNEELCRNTPYCNHNQSSLCGYPNNEPGNVLDIPCDNQLSLQEGDHGSCNFQRISKECSNMVRPSYESTWEDMLFKLHVYYQNNWMGGRTVFNLTFPSPNWNELEYGFYYTIFDIAPICRRFTLSNVTLPLPGPPLFWDCPIFQAPNDSKQQKFELRVVNDVGWGGTYRFTSPKESQIDHWNTPLHEWHVFFFYHLNYLDDPDMPVTLQTVPHKFGRVSYNVSIVKCVRGTVECQQRSVLSSKVITPDENTTEATVLLPMWTTPGIYAFTVQIVSENCTQGGASGCFIAISPVYEEEISRPGIWVSIAFGVIVCFSLTFFITFHKRIKQNRDLIEKLKERPREVLLAYHPESAGTWKLVKTLAAFLQDHCYVHPYMVDEHVGSQDPNQWTRDRFRAVDCVLFLVPAKPNSESITHIRGQWEYVLHYAASHNFLQARAAVLTFPFSDQVPSQIEFEPMFQVPGGMSQLVTWLHRGSWVDRLLLWDSHINSKKHGRKSALANINQAVERITEGTQDCEVNPRSVQLDIIANLGEDSESSSSDSSSDDDDDGRNVKAVENGYDQRIPILDRVHSCLENVSSDSSSDGSDDDNKLK